MIPVHPSEEKQKEVMHIIYDEIKSGKPGTEAIFDDVMDEFCKLDCDVVILACTELSVYKQLIGCRIFVWMQWMCLFVNQL